MANGIRTGDPRGFNKERGPKFRERCRVRQTPEERWKTYRLKHCGNNNKDEDNSPKTLNDKKTTTKIFSKTAKNYHRLFNKNSYHLKELLFRMFVKNAMILIF